VVTRILGPVRSVAEAARLVLRHDHVDFEDAACVLLAAGALTLADADGLAADLPGLRRQAVLTCLTAGDLPAAHDRAERLGDRAWVGYRDIAGWHARRGEAAEALALWRRLAATQERHRMALLKTELVQGVARARGWRAALELTADRRFGPAFRTDALAPLAGTGDVAAVADAVAEAGLDELGQLQLLVTAVVADSPRAPAADHPRLAAVLDRLVAVDPTTDRTTMRTRDALLAGLWPAVGDPATLARLRRALRTPSLKRELTVLPRDCR
jgi:hypothetical protein